MKGQRGFALVLTLLVTALLVALAVQFIDEVYVDTSISHNYVAAQQASILAASGVEGGTRLLQYSQSLQPYSSLLDPWAQPLQFEEDQGKLVISMAEESGKLNLNYLVFPNGGLNQPYYDMAVRLFKRLGLSQDLLDALVDWLDVNDEPRPAGAETDYYGKLKPPYRAKNGPLDTLEELRLVKGFDSATIGKLAPFVTIYADEPGSLAAKININTAPKEILATLSDKMTDDLAARILDRRKTTPFKNASELAQVAGMEGIAQELSLLTTAKGAVYRIRAEALVRETSRLVEAVVRVYGMTPTVLYWREY
jgi:general secretion pathway protein K